MLKYCTLTGIDESTNLNSLWELGQQYPFAEFGVLYSEKRAGNGRYPSINWIEKLTNQVKKNGKPFSLALHICGRMVDVILNSPFHSIYNKNFERLKETLSFVDRIQLNLTDKDNTKHSLIRAFAQQYSDKIIITQHNELNKQLYLNLQDVENHAVLFDSSGGEGKLRKSWPKKLKNKICGYAGGLGHINIEDELPKIHSVAEGDYWIDMEGKLRDCFDCFDLNRAELVLLHVKKFNLENSLGHI